MQAPEKPFANSYWIEPGRLLAGEYPGSRIGARGRVQRLLKAGVTYFLDLTEPGERPAYDGLLPAGLGPGGREVEHVRKPLRDHSVPNEPRMMAQILEHLEGALADGHCVYVHCRAGIGRTGTVLGCYFVQQGRAPQDALDHLQRLWEDNGLGAVWPHTPETDEQVEYVRAWRPLRQPAAETHAAYATPAAAPADAHDTRAVDARDRYHGALLGLAIGDALGASVQGRQPGTFAPLTDLTGGGPFDLPRGAWTDDTAMAMCLADSLLACRGFDAADQVSRYWRWQREGYWSSTGRCIGITASVTKALASAQWTRKPYAGSHDPARLDKEPLSRVAPVVLYFARHPQEAVERAAEAARPTHQSPGILKACRDLATLLLQLLAGADKQDLVLPAWEGGGTVSVPPAHPVEAALRALRTSGNFRDGALTVANLGGDSDVNAAVYGQLAGALYGLQGIPAEWRASVLKGPLIEGIADRLFAQG